MLRNSFLHVPRVNREIENIIWRNNIFNWDEFFLNIQNIPLPENKKESIAQHLRDSIEAFERKDFSFFSKSLPSNQHWRLYPELREKCCFLDIETTGLSKHNDDVTVVGLYNGKESKIFVNGVNLSEFESEFSKYDMVVTYNGKCFDIPFLKAKFPNVNFDKIHIDLRYVMREIGYSGGLKYIERAVGIKRGDEIASVDGFEAVRLWYKYLRGDEGALETLMKYNQADIENLKVLMEFAFDKLKEKHLFSE